MRFPPDRLAQALAREKEALQQQTATAEILKVISSSPSDLQPVFDAIARSAQKLFKARAALVCRRVDDMLHLAAHTATTDDGDAALRRLYPTKITGEGAVGKAVLNGKPACVVDVEADPAYSAEFRAGARERGYRSLLAVPMLRQGFAIGAIYVTRREPGLFTDRQVNLLQIFADQAVIAIENVRLFKETREALEQQTATAAILKVISSSPTDITPVLNAVAANAKRLCEANDALVQLREGDNMRFMAHDGDIPVQNMGAVLPISKGLVTGRAILERRQLHIHDHYEEEHEYPEGTALARQYGFRTMLVTPLIRSGEAVGTIVIRRREVRPFSESHLALVKTFADQAAIAIENARLFNETKESLEQQKASAEVLGAISSSIADTSPVFEKIMQSCERLFQGHFMGIGLVSEDSRIRIVARRGLQVLDAPKEPITTVPFTKEAGAGLAILERRVVHYPDVFGQQDVAPFVRKGAEKSGFKSIVFAPMFWEDQGIGAIWVGRSVTGPFSEKQIALLKTFADQAVIAIQNARLFMETKEALEQQKASAEVLGTISSSIADTRPVFDKILESCARLFNGHESSISLVGEDGLIHLAAHRGRRAQELNRLFPLPLSRESGTGAAILDRRVMHYPDVANGADVPHYVRRSAEKTEFQSVVFAPMYWEDHGVGAIVVGRPFTGAFTEKQIALLKSFADQAVIAIQNARLFREIQEKSAQLEAANKHKSDFLANMSHELRTPLNAIIGFSEALMDKMFGELNEKQLEYQKDIHESGKHLLSLINDILDLSKIEAGKMELELSTFDLPTALSNAVTLIRERAQRHGIALGVALDSRLGDFTADERKLKQVLLNLLSNAVKFTPDGGRVDVAAKLDTDKVEIAVKDTGVGISPEDQRSLFEEFKQLGNDSNRKAEGTGLGLALTKRLVELHGGHISVESAVGQGSTFRIALPVLPVGERMGRNGVSVATRNDHPN